MSKPSFLLASIIHDCEGPRLNADKAPWALGCADELLAHLAEEGAKCPPGKDEKLKALKRLLTRLREHFATNGKSGMTQATAKSKALELKKQWTQVLSHTLDTPTD